MSLKSISTKKEILEISSNKPSKEALTSSDSFTEAEMKVIWYKFATKLEENGEKIEAAILHLADPKLEGDHTILIELPNETSLRQFDSKKAILLNLLKTKLNNSSITIEVIINEEVAKKNAYTDADKYERLKEINPNLELLQQLFDLYY